MKAIAGAALTVALAIASVAVYLLDTGSGAAAQPTAESSGPTPGLNVFLAAGCVGCHSLGEVPGNTTIGPDLTDVDQRAATRAPGLSSEQYIRQSLREPQAFLVPGYGTEMPTLPLTDPEVDALVDLLLAA
jgi:mono/diheme cytochrome c family protein